MAVAGAEGEVTFWYLEDGTISWRLPPRQLRGPVDRLAASTDGKRFATLEYDVNNTLVRVWEIHNRRMLAEVKVDPYAVADIALDTQGRILYVSHEKKGLLQTDVSGRAPLKPVGGDGWQCRGRLQWMEPGLLSCAVPAGALQIDRSGRKKSELLTGTEAPDWIVAMAESGKRTVAVGGGLLLIWWNNGR